MVESIFGWWIEHPRGGPLPSTGAHSRNAVTRGQASRAESGGFRLEGERHEPDRTGCVVELVGDPIDRPRPQISWQ